MKKPNSGWIAIASLVAAMGMVSNAHAVWTFNANNATDVVATSPSAIGDPKVSLSGVFAVNGTNNAGFAAGSTGNWAAGSLNWAGTGYGMVSGTSDTSANPFSGIDNNQNTEAMLLTFSSSVTLSGVGLGYVSDNSGTVTYDTVDMSVFRWVGTGAPTTVTPTLVGASAAAMGAAASGWELVGNYGDMAVGTSAPSNLVNTGGSSGSSWWLISAYNSGFTQRVDAESRSTFDSGNDYFRLYAVAGAACTGTNCGPKKVPEPGSFALAGLALLGLTLSRRRLSRMR